MWNELNTVVVFPNAKINLGLRVVGRRDDSFHNIETVFYPVGWCDILEVIENDSIAEKKIDFTVSGNALLNSEDNLCVRAFRLLENDFKIPPAKAWLHKIIPAGAGLGGGSSDAVNMILLLNKLFSLKISNEKIKEYALQLGSDCPFFLSDKPMYATGRGEVMEEIPEVLKNFFIFIVKPKFSISTAEAYRLVKPNKPQSTLKDLIQLPVQQWKNSIVNDFAIPLGEKFPEINSIKNKFYDAGAVFSLMSGSGSAVYGIFEKETEGGKIFPGYESWSGRL